VLIQRITTQHGALRRGDGSWRSCDGSQREGPDSDFDALQVTSKRLELAGACYDSVPGYGTTNPKKKTAMSSNHVQIVTFADEPL
jgi:hypothetical protein